MFMELKIFNTKGAEAEIFQIVFEDKKAILKERVKKNYRVKVLDDIIRKRRTKSESKIIKKLDYFVQVPKIYQVNEFSIVMEFIEGKQLKKIINRQKDLCILAGKEIKKIHAQEIIHGDLTTSNIIVRKLKSSGQDKLGLVFIDFGLGYFSNKIEDKATDLIVFKKTFNATHSSIKNGWGLVMKGYAPSQDIIKRMELIEKRARYH
jgi:Kae1-associated kinase Bud32